MEPLRILVVDDDPDKLTRVLSCLRQDSDRHSDQIDTAHNANEARRYLKENQYDLLILDIALPDRAEDAPTPSGGIKLLEEVLERDSFLKPREVVGLTAFSEVLENAGRRFAEDLWLVIHFDPTSDNWAEQLNRKLKYIRLAKRNSPIPEYGCHLCIVTALQSPEFKAVLEVPWNWRQWESSNDPAIYYEGHFDRNKTNHKVFASCASRMGMTASAILATKMIQALRPRYIAMCGILAGANDEASFGDVVAVDPCWDWGSGKYYVNENKHQFAPAPYQLAVNSFIRSKLSLMASSAAVMDEIRNNWKGSAVESVLKLHIGPVASGASVLADEQMTKSVGGQHRKLIGIEMESYAIFAAADEAPLPQPKAFSIKSISDFAGMAKNDEHHAYAAYTSATALRIFVERYL
jgi:nucleoside phosphorylase/CheY-like chemotaxis protein